MITTNTTYQNLISAGAHYEWRITNGTGSSHIFTKANIISGSITSTLFDGLSIGNTIASQLDLTLQDVTVDTTKPLVVQFRAATDSSTSDWFTKGTFYIDTVETSPYSDITNITAFDAMLKAEYPYQLKGEWTPVTDLIALNRITGDIGVAMESSTQTLFENNPKNLTASPNIGTDGTTEREMLSYIGAMRGGNWFINSANQLQLVILSATASNMADIGDAVVDFDASPAETIQRVRVWIDDDTFYAFPELPLQTHTPETIQTQSLQDILVRAAQFVDEWEAVGGRCIDVSIPFYATYSVAKTIYNQFNGKSYYPYKTGQAYIPPEYEIGDRIKFKTENSVTSILANQTIDISPLAMSSAEFKKEEVINSYYPYKSAFQRKTDYQVSKNTAAIAKNTAQIESNTEDIAAVPSLIEHQTTLISGGYGGYIKYTYLADGTPSEILFMDTPSEDTATNIIRINRNGIGFSTDGGETYANAWTIDGKLNADFIRTGTLSADRIAAGSLAITKLDSDAQSTISDASSNASAALAAANGANNQEQLIYISKVAGTTSVTAPSSWVTANAGAQNTWGIKRPQYNSSYPVCFVATQRKAVDGTVTCTTPLIDETTTVIDGGRIITGSVTANQLAANSVTAEKIETGSIAIGKLDSDAQNTISTASSNASSALTKANESLTATVSCYYRSTTNTTPSINSSTTIGTSATTDNAWEYVMPRPKNGCYFYTCEKYTKGDGTVSFSTVRALSNATYTSMWCSSSDAAYIDGGKIYANSVTASQIASSTITSTQLANSVNTAISDAASAASAAQTTANGANSREQIIYISKASGTTSVSANTTWVTSSTDTQNAWRIRRPTYNSSYPVVFTAIQSQTVAQAANSGTTCSCTTPVIDNTTTVIDGGHITTGSIDASLITTGILKAITIQDTGTSPKNYWDLSTGQFVTQQGTLGGFTINDSGMVASSVIGEMMITPSTIYTQNLSPARMASMSGGQLTLSVKDSDLNWQSCMNIYALSLPNNKRNGTIAGPNNLTYINMGESSINIHMDSSLGGQEMILSGNGISFNSGNGYFSITTGTGIFTVNSHQVLEIH